MSFSEMFAMLGFSFVVAALFVGVVALIIKLTGGFK